MMKKIIGLIMAITITNTLFGAIIFVGDSLRWKTVQPGQTYTEELILKNSSLVAEEALLYFTSYQTRADGTTLFEDPATNPRSNAGWFIPIPRRVSIEAGKASAVTVTITVPKDPQLKGSFWSILMIEPVTTETVNRGGVAVKLIGRIAIQFISDVVSDPMPEKRLDITATGFDKASWSIYCDVENPGTLAVRPTLWAEIRNGQERVIRIAGGPKTVYPGSSMRFSRELRKDLKPGAYTARVFLDTGKPGELWSKDFAFVF